MNGLEHNKKASEFIGQEVVKEFFDRIFSTGKIGSAFLFEGLNGVGKFAGAIEFAKRLKCTDLADGLHPCNQCYNCKQINHLTHPDLEIVLPLPTGLDKPADKLGDKELNSLMEIIETKSANPYYLLKFKEAVCIRIDTIRNLEFKLAQTASEPGGKIAIIVDADMMTTEAANAFLKTLEEPASDVYLILTTSKPTFLLPTILSRTQQVHFKSLRKEEIEHFLVDIGVDEDEALLVSRLSRGSLGIAYDLLSPEYQRIRKDAADAFGLFFQEDDLAVIDWVDNFLSDNKIGEIEIMLDNLCSITRDLIIVRHSSSVKLIENADKEARLTELNKSIRDTEILFNLLDFLDDTMKSLQMNPNLNLLMLDTIFTGRKIIRGEDIREIKSQI